MPLVNCDWGRGLIAGHKDEKVCRQAIPKLISFLMNIANTKPVRGMFAGGGQLASLTVLEAQWDKEIEQTKDSVSAVCRSFVRLPEMWYEQRIKSFAVIKKMSPACAPAIREYIASEKLWLKEVDRDLLQLIGDRGKMIQLIDYLDYVAECVESGKKITKPCPVPLEEKKQYQDKVPDVGDVNLDDLKLD